MGMKTNIYKYIARYVYIRSHLYIYIDAAYFTSAAELIRRKC